MARRPAICSAPRVIVLAGAIFGLLTTLAPRPAAAQPVAAQPTDGPVTAPDPSETLPSTPRVAPDEYPPPSARRYLIIGGFASTAVWYGGVLAASYAVDDPSMAKALRIPVAGPWMALGHTGCGGSSNCNTLLVVLGAIATTLDGVGQAAGLALAAEGLFMPTQEPKRAHAALREKKSGDFAWHPSFDAGKNGLSFGVVGVF